MYKLQGFNGVKRADGVLIPFADGNTDYEEYKLWLADGNIPEPEFTEEDIQKQELQIKITEALKYLGDTDFYYPRYLETGEPVPTDVVVKRQESRAFLRENTI